VGIAAITVAESEAMSGWHLISIARLFGMIHDPVVGLWPTVIIYTPH
jgi:hypothetical protein